MVKIFKSLPFRLILAIVLGAVLGQVSVSYSNINIFAEFNGESVMKIAITLKYILGQIIIFCVPLIIIGFIAPSITKLGRNASKVLFVAVSIAYISSVGAALLSMSAGYMIIPALSIVSNPEGLKELPDIVFKLNIPQIMPVMSALFFSVLIGLSAAWTKADNMANLLDEFQQMVLKIVVKIIIPILPFFIGLTFMSLSYEGSLTTQLIVFLKIILIVLIGHFIWLFVLYSLAGIYSRKNPIEVIKHYLPAYLTAVGTMSSAATLAVALNSANKSEVLRKDMVSFGIPLFANIHLCGSVLTEVFFVMAVSQILYGAIPPLSLMVIFCFLLAVFAIGAPGVPGGTVMASLGLISGFLGFDETGVALMLTIFALQDSFGTACNVTGDGALTLIMTGYSDKNNIKEDIYDIKMN